MHHRPHWSYSAISQYLACPLRYYFQRVLRLPQPTVGSSLVLGISVHAVLAEYHRAVQQDEPTDIPKLHRVFSESWVRRENETQVSYRNSENRSDLMAQGISLVELYLQEPPPANIVAIEETILAPLHNTRGEYLETPLMAVADLITEDAETLTIGEFKTSSRAYSESEVETSLQPTCYVNAVLETTGVHAAVEYTVLVKTKTPKVQRLTTVRNEADLGRLGDIVENIERAIQAQAFYPVETPLNCSTCPFRQPCREWGQSDSPELIQLNIKSAEAGAC
jgi:CRISPR/Cas system-associated exonuclease Cas4 (RecB family)